MAEKAANPDVGLTGLPEAVLVRIMGFLGVPDLVHLGQACTTLRKVAGSDGVWKRPCGRLREKSKDHLKEAYAKVFVSSKTLLTQVNSKQVRVTSLVSWRKKEREVEFLIAIARLLRRPCCPLRRGIFWRTPGPFSSCGF